MDTMMAGIGGGLWSLAAFIVALSIIVAVHEYGHYIVGRWSGIRAEVFSLGFGPKLVSRHDRRGTLWQIAAIPLGGYVRFLGDSNAASAGTGRAVDPARARETLGGAPLWARIATVAAGPVFNFVLATLIFAGFALVLGRPMDSVTVGETVQPPPGVVSELIAGDEILAIDGVKVADWQALNRISKDVKAAPVHDWLVRRDGQDMTVRGPDPSPALINGIAPNSAAARAGLLPGDVILSVDDVPLVRFDDLRQRVEAAQGKPLALEVWRKGADAPLAITLSPREQDTPAEGGGFEKRWMIGVVGGGSYFQPAMQSVGPVEALGQGVSQTLSIIGSSLSGIKAMVTGQIGSCNLGGAISIAEGTGQAANAGLGNFLWWIAVLSVAIGFLNLLPIPVLDGGHLAFYLYEAVAGRPPSPRAINLLTSIGMALVLGLMIFGLSNDLRCR